MSTMTEKLMEAAESCKKADDLAELANRLSNFESVEVRTVGQSTSFTEFTESECTALSMLMTKFVEARQAETRRLAAEVSGRLEKDDEPKR